MKFFVLGTILALGIAAMPQPDLGPRALREILDSFTTKRDPAGRFDLGELSVQMLNGQGDVVEERAITAEQHASFTEMSSRAAAADAGVSKVESVFNKRIFGCDFGKPCLLHEVCFFSGRDECFKDYCFGTIF